MLPRTSLLALAALSLASSVVVAQEKTARHKVAVQVNQNDPKLMNLALNNVQNVFAYYKKKGETVAVELVAYGPGLHIFRDDTSPVKERLSKMALEEPSLKFSACANTLAKQTAAAKKEIKLVSEATLVPSGVITLIELQEKGYSYIRP
ncbi:MAG: DsrE family protein [Hyphomicrobiaceae bacterium]